MAVTWLNMATSSHLEVKASDEQAGHSTYIDSM